VYKIFLKMIFLNMLLYSALFAENFKTDIKPLTKFSFKLKEKTVKQLYKKYTNDKRLNTLLKSMLHNKLYYTKQGKNFVVLVKKNGKLYDTFDLLTGKKEQPISKYALKRVKVNNKLRSIIRDKLAKLNLFSTSKQTRLTSARDLLKNINKKSIFLVKKALLDEKDKDVKNVLIQLDTILKAKFGINKEEKLKAVSLLSNYVSKYSLQTLEEIKRNTKDDNIKEATQKSIDSIKSKQSIYQVVEKIFFGLSLGSVLLLAAIGLAITFGVMKVINMAHGELIMIGAYTTYTLQQILPSYIEYSIFLAIPLAFVVSGLFGIVIERVVIRHLYGRPLETLLATFGISLILQQLARTIYSPLNKDVITPQWMSGAWQINGTLSFTYNRLYIIILSLLVFAGILFVLNKTSLGLKIRAVTQNRQMAQAMGIRTGLIDALTFGLGSGVAGIAGVALSQLTNVGPNLGQSYIVNSFMVIVFGGVGNLWGTLIAAITLGEVNKFLEPVVGAVLGEVIILIFIILFIQKKPRGLFPQKGRDEEE
jgi:urea transport system permease protein